MELAGVPARPGGRGGARWPAGGRSRCGCLDPSAPAAPRRLALPSGGLCLSPERAGISWLNVPGAAIQYLGSKYYFYCILFILSSAFEICFPTLKIIPLSWGRLIVPGHTWPPMWGICDGPAG